MPKRRRKRSTKTKSVKDIPYTKYRVDWVDAISESDWADEYEFDKMSLATPVNEGWVYEKTKNSTFVNPPLQPFLGMYPNGPKKLYCSDDK